MTPTEFRQKQGLPYEAKVTHAEIRAREFYEEMCKRDKNVHIPVEGLDSIVLLLFLRKVAIDLAAAMALKHDYNKTRSSRHGGKQF